MKQKSLATKSLKKEVDLRSRISLSEGSASPATPTGVEHLLLQSTSLINYFLINKVKK